MTGPGGPPAWWFVWMFLCTLVGLFTLGVAIWAVVTLVNWITGGGL